MILLLPQVEIATILNRLEYQWMRLLVEIYYSKGAPERGFDEVDVEMLPGVILPRAPPVSSERLDEVG